MNWPVVLLKGSIYSASQRRLQVDSDPPQVRTQSPFTRKEIVMESENVAVAVVCNVIRCRTAISMDSCSGLQIASELKS